MEKTVTKHEWYLHHIDCHGNDIYRCVNCPAQKRTFIDDSSDYQEGRDEDYEDQEPPCITRKIQEDVTKDK